MQDIKRQKARLEALKKEAEEERERARDAARERVLLEFERGQLGLSGPSSAITTSGADSQERALRSLSLAIVYSDPGGGALHPARGTKRKFSFSSSTAETLAQEAEEAALRTIEREQAEALKHKLPDFWLPSLTPTYASSGPPTSLADVKLQTTCRGGNPAHPISYAFPCLS